MYYAMLSVTDAAGNETPYQFSGNWTVIGIRPVARI